MDAYELQGISEGISQGINNYYNLQSVKQSLKQKEEEFNLNKKIKELELKSLEGKTDPEIIQSEKDILKLQHNINKNTLSMYNTLLEQGMRKEQQRVKDISNYANGGLNATKDLMQQQPAQDMSMLSAYDMKSGTLDYGKLQEQQTIKSIDSYLQNKDIQNLRPEEITQVKRMAGANKNAQEYVKNIIPEGSENQQIAKVEALDSAREALNTINEIEKNVDLFGVRSVIPALPGTSKVNWNANLDRLKSQLVLDTIKKIRSASKTGATGFGNMTEKELAILQNASTALRKDLSKEDAQRYLNEMKLVYNKVLNENDESETENNNSRFVASNDDISSLFSQYNLE